MYYRQLRGAMPVANTAVLALVVVLYCIFSTCEIVIIKQLDKMAVILPVLTCICENGYWPVQGLMYVELRKRNPAALTLSFHRARGYIVIGIVASATSLLRCVGINGLPGSVYVVVSCSDVVFNTLLNKFCLKKNFTKLHYLAVMLTCSAIALLAVKDHAPTVDHHLVLAMHAGNRSSKVVAGPPSHNRRLQQGEITSHQVWPLVAALTSALCSASNSVLSDFLLTKDKNKGLLAVSEASFFNSIIPFFVMPVVMVLSGEIHQYEPEWERLGDVPASNWQVNPRLH